MPFVLVSLIYFVEKLWILWPVSDIELVVVDVVGPIFHFFNKETWRDEIIENGPKKVRTWELPYIEQMLNQLSNDV